MTAVASTGASRFKFDASLETLVTKREVPSTAILLEWLQVIAHGGELECEGQRWRLKPGIRYALHVHVDPAFVCKHTRLYGALRKAMVAYGSKWGCSSQKGLKLSDRSSFIALLLRAQCAIRVRQ